jgi:hypothetical protein
MSDNTINNALNDITIDPAVVITPPTEQDSDDGAQAVQAEAVQAEAGEGHVNRVPEPPKVYEREIRTKGCRLLPECFANIATGTWIVVGPSQYSEGYSYPLLPTFDETMKLVPRRLPSLLSRRRSVTSRRSLKLPMRQFALSRLRCKEWLKQRSWQKLAASQCSVKRR